MSGDDRAAFGMVLAAAVLPLLLGPVRGVAVHWSGGEAIGTTLSSPWYAVCTIVITVAIWLTVRMPNRRGGDHNGGLAVLAGVAVGLAAVPLAQRVGASALLSFALALVLGLVAWTLAARGTRHLRG